MLPKYLPMFRLGDPVSSSELILGLALSAFAQVVHHHGEGPKIFDTVAQKDTIYVQFCKKYCYLPRKGNLNAIWKLKLKKLKWLK